MQKSGNLKFDARLEEHFHRYLHKACGGPPLLLLNKLKPPFPDHWHIHANQTKHGHFTDIFL